MRRPRALRRAQRRRPVLQIPACAALASRGERSVAVKRRKSPRASLSHPAASGASPQNAAIRTNASHGDFQSFLAVPTGDGPARQRIPRKATGSGKSTPKRRCKPLCPGRALPSAGPSLSGWEGKAKTPSVGGLSISRPAASGASPQSAAIRTNASHGDFSILPCRPRRGRPPSGPDGQRTDS